MRYIIKNPNLGGLNLERGEDIDTLDATIRQASPEVEGWSYSFIDFTLTIDGPPGLQEYFSTFGQVEVEQ